ncbi:MAG: ATP-dependent helicase [Clostridiales bacterium]|nr:ATP-dependent helicase [Clostridiales bacterium]
MIQQEKIVQFYFAQYRDGSKKLKKKNTEGKNTYERRIKSLLAELRRTGDMKITQVRLEDYHRQIRNISWFAFRQENQIAIMQIRDYLLPELVRLDLALLKLEEQEMITAKFLEYLRTEVPFRICTRTLRDLCRHYSEYGIKKEIVGLVPMRPEMEFPKALEMERRFILHIGPTNCGKTYQALERLRTAENGVYLGPLRLLALEVYEKMKDNGLACTMLTGEECISEENSRVIASTIEMLDLEQNYDIAVIDEAQMVTDPDRGHSWTRAILGVLAPEIHICMSPAAEKAVTHLIELCGDRYEICRYERKTKLVCEAIPFRFPEDVQEGDALIVFTKRAVLDIAGRLEAEGTRASVVYGSLPPEIRRRQIRQFSRKKTKVVVSTDAIGMGLNLPVRRIVFVQTEKFDGKNVRPLNVSEILQIAGRAGRYGMYDTGYINAMGPKSLNYIQEKLKEKDPEIETVSLGFPHMLLDMEDPLNTILKVWKSVEPSAPFEKISIDEILFLYDQAYSARKEIDGFEDKHILYRMLTCSIDIKNRDIVDLWLHYCKTYTADISLEFPSLERCRDAGLMKYETFYKMLDLYHQFANRLGKEMDGERLEKERERTEDRIMSYLSRDKKDYIRKCKYCGRTLPVGCGYRVCDMCHTEDRMRGHQRRNQKTAVWKA